MDRQTLQELRLVLEPFVKERGFELVDLYFRYEGGRTVLGILADRPEGGITIDECTFLNSELGVMMMRRIPSASRMSWKYHLRASTGRSRLKKISGVVKAGQWRCICERL